MDYDQLIRNWHAKAPGEDYFSGFVFEYLAFIAFLKKRKFIQSTDDRRAIQFLKQDNDARDAYLNLVQNDQELATAWTMIVAELGRARLGNVSGSGDSVQEIIWWNCDRLEVNQKSTEDNKKINGVIYDLHDWVNMVEFVYSIRNNLFHGGKDPEDERDQLLVSNGFTALSPLVELLINSGR